MSDRPYISKKSQEINKSKKVLNLSNNSLHERLFESAKNNPKNYSINESRKSFINSNSPSFYKIKTKPKNTMNNSIKLCNLKIDLSNAVKEPINNKIESNDIKANRTLNTTLEKDYKKYV